jgi:hypothetical protein
VTVEKRTTISLEDILAVEYQCPHCNSRYNIPIEKFDRAINQCSNCKEPLVAMEASLHPQDLAFKDFVQTLKNLKNRGIAKIIRLEIVSESEKQPQPPRGQ